MRILYLTDSYPDYLSDDLLYGLRALLGPEVVDYPHKEILYRGSGLKEHAKKMYGRGFHLFGLEEVEIDRSDIPRQVRSGHFDAIINSSAWRIDCPLHPRLVVFDGEDHRELNLRYWNRGPLYFKRELDDSMVGVEPILFALPDPFFDEAPAPKVKKCHASYTVNSPIRRELQAHFPPDFSFSTWPEYLLDIKQAWFGLSPKGAGYDCQRHYEIFGQAVLCIYLDERAPRLLKGSFTDGVNCLVFRTVKELLEKMERCREPGRLIEAARADLKRRHLASRRAEAVLRAIDRAGMTKKKPSWLSRLEWSWWFPRRAKKLARPIKLKDTWDQPQIREPQSSSSTGTPAS